MCVCVCVCVCVRVEGSRTSDKSTNPANFRADVSFFTERRPAILPTVIQTQRNKVPYCSSNILVAGTQNALPPV